ncbi:hypothetical protein DUI70_0789 [Streptomyces albus]|nr:hypothetical protein DUI70_0789 [Streptomyces albus]
MPGHGPSPPQRSGVRGACPARSAASHSAARVCGVRGFCER